MPPSVIEPLKEKGNFTVKDDDTRFNGIWDCIKEELNKACKNEYINMIKYKPTRKMLKELKLKFGDEYSFVKDEDLLGKKKEEVTEEQKKMEEEKEKNKVESDVVMKDEKHEDIEEIRETVKKEMEEKKNQKKEKKAKKYTK